MSEHNDWVTPEELFHPYFSDEFLEGRTTKSYNPYKDRDLFGLFLMLVNIEYQYYRKAKDGAYDAQDTDYWDHQEEWTEHFTGMKGIGMDPASVTKLLYPNAKELSNFGQYKKIRRLFHRLEELSLIKSIVKEKRVTSYEVDWYGFFIMILDLIEASGSAEKILDHIFPDSKEKSMKDRKTFKLLANIAPSLKQNSQTPDKWKGVAVHNEQVIKYIKKQFRLMAHFF